MTIKGCPKIVCPECQAVLCKAVGKGNKNKTQVHTLKDNESCTAENIDGDYLIKCHKCGKYVVIKNNNGMVKVPMFIADCTH
jgi:hypothetical protein